MTTMLFQTLISDKNEITKPEVVIVIAPIFKMHVINTCKNTLKTSYTVSMQFIQSVPALYPFICL